MFKPFPCIKPFCILLLSPLLLAITGCSPKIKIGLWAKTHQEAATSLGIWIANNPDEATTLLNLDCTDRKEFKKKITDALNNTPTEPPAQQKYDVRQHNYHYGNLPLRGSSSGFEGWCRKNPKAAKKLRSHAKALCKAGLGILNGTYKIN